MKRLYLFNPENDLALAADMPHFTPPSAALKLKSAACMLPMWYADEDDYIMVSDECLPTCVAMAERHGIKVTFVTEVPVDVTGISPWGWSRHTRQQLLSHGCKPLLLPDDGVLDNIRNLSHRRLTVQIYNALKNNGFPYPLPPVPQEVSSLGYLTAELEAGRYKFVKSPWSGSGRGVVDTMTMPTRQVLRLAEGGIKRQGSVMVEERLTKVCDFAMLFDMKYGEAHFVGYSVFFNENYSTYGGNILADNDQLEAMIGRYVSVEQLLVTRRALEQAVVKVIDGKYEGPLGIDMMVYRCGDEYRVAQCVEVNLRMTMGRVAHELVKRRLPSGHKGMMKIVPTRNMAVETSDNILYLTPKDGNDFAFVMKLEL
ncbi:MAG: hypothetical protein K2K86_00550 [Muribaculaceae bacterium]|nr:hypothetical protein [Muribaculaceae bacterium]